MKNQTRIAKASARIVQEDRNTWIPIYYSPAKQDIYTREGEGRYLMMYLIRENTAEEIVDAIERYRRL